MSQTAPDPDTSPEPSAICGGPVQRVVHRAGDGRDSVSPSLAERLGVRLGPATSFATTEHFNLQTAHSITVAEANGRASIYLAALSTNAYTPEGVDRAAIFVPPSPQADTA